MLQQTCDLLAAMFGRPITGIHNRSLGIVGDLLECLIQRDFSYATLDVRVTYEALNVALQDDTIRKLVIIAHSQGGILVSLALERLYSELPVQVFGKLVPPSPPVFQTTPTTPLTTCPGNIHLRLRRLPLQKPPPLPALPYPRSQIPLVNIIILFPCRRRHNRTARPHTHPTHPTRAPREPRDPQPLHPRHRALRQRARPRAALGCAPRRWRRRPWR